METTWEQSQFVWVIRVGMVGWMAIIVAALGYAWSTSSKRFDEQFLKEKAIHQQLGSNLAESIPIQSFANQSNKTSEK